MAGPSSMNDGDRLAIIIIALAALVFVITVKAQELVALIETLIGGAA